MKMEAVMKNRKAGKQMKKSDTKKNNTGGAKKIAAVRIRGGIKLSQRLLDTLNNLRLYRKNYCSVYENTDSNAGMLRKVKDYVTWGEIDEAVLNELLTRRGEEFRGREFDRKKKIRKNFISFGGKRLKAYFRLSPPRGGFERKGIKNSFRRGGALGYRKEKINELIRKML